MRSGSGEVPYGVQAMLGGPYLYIGEPERAVDWCRTRSRHVTYSPGQPWSSH